MAPRERSWSVQLMGKRCGMTTKKGTRCKAPAIKGGWQCVFHSQRHMKSWRALQD